MPLITVITVVRNAAGPLEKTIKSVLGQTSGDIEYIVIDGASTDGTLDVIRRYADRLSRWVSEPDAGTFDAFNKGIDAATGEWVNFMNAGDEFYSDTIVDELRGRLIGAERGAERGADVVYGDEMFMYDWGHLTMSPDKLESLGRHMALRHQATFTRTEALRSYRFNTAYRIGADYDLFYRMYRDGRVFSYVPLILSKYDTTGLSYRFEMRRYKEDAMITGRAREKTFCLRYAVHGLRNTLRKAALSCLPAAVVHKIRLRGYRKNPLIRDITVYR